MDIYGFGDEVTAASKKTHRAGLSVCPTLLAAKMVYVSFEAGRRCFDWGGDSV